MAAAAAERAVDAEGHAESHHAAVAAESLREAARTTARPKASPDEAAASTRHHPPLARGNQAVERDAALDATGSHFRSGFGRTCCEKK